MSDEGAQVLLQEELTSKVLLTLLKRKVSSSLDILYNLLMAGMSPSLEVALKPLAETISIQLDRNQSVARLPQLIELLEEAMSLDEGGRLAPIIDELADECKSCT